MRVLPVLLVAVTSSLASIVGAQAQPQIPATYFGSVTVDGAAAAAGTEVRGIVDGLDCTQAPPGQQPVFIDGEVAAYVLYVVHDSQRPGCARAGSLVTFTIGGRPAVQTATWSAGPMRLDLSTGSASPIPLPSATNTPASAGQTPPGPGATPGTPGTGAAASAPVSRPTVTPPTGDVRFDQTPVPPGATPPAPEDGGPGGSPVWLVLAGTLITLAGGAGAAGYFLSRKHRRPPNSPLP